MKKIFYLLLVLTLILSMTSCAVGKEPVDGSESTDVPSGENENVATEPVELVVFAAASMTETLTEISDLYAEVSPHVTLIFNFDSSGTMKTQIQEGAECDVFLSASQKPMNQLDIAASSDINTEGLDFVLEDTRVDILENQVTLCVPEGNPKNITSFDALADMLRAKNEILLGMGNSDVPVGQYTQKILTYYELHEEELAQAGLITYGNTVKEVATQIAQGSIDCGVVYCTDAYSANLDIVDYATAAMCGQVVYPAAVLKGSSQPIEAQAFLDYLQTPEAMEVFESVGFSPAP